MIFYVPHWEFIFLYKWYPGIGKNIPFIVNAQGNMFDMALKLPSYFYLVIEKPLEPKNDKNQHYWQESSVFISLNQSQLM